MSNILIVMSAADVWERADGTAYPTGYWAEELAAPHERFVRAGHTVDFASPGGVLQPLDRHSADPAIAGENCAHYVAHAQKALGEFGPLLPLEDVDASAYDAIFLPGGHGPVVDLFEDRDLGRLLIAADHRNTVIGAVCHGPAALLSAVDDNGRWAFEGRRIAAFTNEEEELFGTADNAPWLQADRLAEQGARLEKGAPYEPFVVQDGNLFTGQNPASSGPLADAVNERLEELRTSRGR
ncbi:type 1 glutamine amidotransferase domain-containing protein [Streptomyces apricus]|uniref:Type 1 glutamine amidotransferase domain-containing protein n=1 Tax=Streptomyces apricus TaxID=1828112 RepID=A0A5B0AML0_9ACTN|nr:type 1 glutamine amidotransferase domain-containing protein [Streptomyces apricus]KAA0929845.1 type 1 glutamine amidotransferase domain-containing protein [Streptomyces apricus]